MDWRYSAPAVQELKDAWHFYGREADGLDQEFLDELESTIDRAISAPGSWQRVSDEHHRCRLRRFPYSIIYSVEEDSILIVALMHSRRNPDSWRENL